MNSDSSEPVFYKLALIGHPLGHSRSPEMHKRALANCNLQGSYELIDIPEFPESELAATVQRLKDEGYAGFNVTIPYKEKIIPLLDDVDKHAKKIGAVNTVSIDLATRRATGCNTDMYGIGTSVLKFFDMRQRPHYIHQSTGIILGSGGAARACMYTLGLMGFQKILVCARNEVKGAELVRYFNMLDQEESLSATKHNAQSTERFVLCTLHNVQSTMCVAHNAEDNASAVWRQTPNAQHPALSALRNAQSVFAEESPLFFVNATPLGQSSSGQIDSAFFDELVSLLPDHCWVFDMVYATEDAQTPLVMAAKKRELKARDGWNMLGEQAVNAFKIWTGRTVSEQVMLGRETLS